MGQWNLIAADLLDIGVDVESGILAQRSGRWLSNAINGLITGDTRIGRWLAAERKKQLEEIEREANPERAEEV